MSGLDKYDYEKLLDDIKLISRSIRIVRDEKNFDKRKYNAQLTEDLITRLYRDVTEMYKQVSLNGNGYGGYLENKK